MEHKRPGRNEPPNMTDYTATLRDFSFPKHETFNFGFDVVDKWAAKPPFKDHVALLSLVDDNDLTPLSFSFADLAQRSNRSCNALEELGLNPFDTVLLLLPRIPEWYDAVLGMIKRGIIWIPTTVYSSAEDIQYRLQISEAKAVICAEDLCERVDSIARERVPNLKHKLVVHAPSAAPKTEHSDWLSLNTLMQKAEPVVHIDKKHISKAEDTMMLFFTSGTTGKPKMVRHTHDYPLGHWITAYFVQDLRPNDLHWTLSDTGWAKAAYGNIFGQWLVGATVLQHQQGMDARFDAAKTLRIIEKYKVSTFCAPPTAYRMLILENLKSFDLSSLRHCQSAGEPLNPEVIVTWKEGTGLDIHDFYGQTETVSVLANFRCNPIKYGSMGKPAPGAQITIVDDEGNPVPVNTEGHIAIKTDPRPTGLFHEYWKSEEKTKEVFHHGYYYTLDKAYRDEDGYFWYVGRADDVIKSAGYRIGPFEIESVLLEHDAVVESGVVGVPDPEGIRGQIVKAFVVLAKGHTGDAQLVNELQNWVKTRTAPYKYPRQIEFVNELPKTVSGKIKRNELRLLALKQQTTTTSATARL